MDDVKLGLLIRRAGGKTRAFLGNQDVECHWSVGIRDLIKIMEKNYFAAIDYRISVGTLVGAVLLFWVASIVGPFTNTFLGWTAFAAMLSVALPAIIVSRRIGWSVRAALLTPFIFPVLYYAVLNSMITTLRQGGVRWRDTFYPLDLLRRGNVR